jgi:hypothetical protein
MGSQNNMEYKTIKVDTKSFDELKGEILLQACHYNNLDFVGDILLPGSCTDDINLFQEAKATNTWGITTQLKRFLYEHNSADILNISLDDLFDTKNAPVIRGTICEQKRQLEPDKCNEIFQLIKDGKMFASIGYTIQDYEIKDNIRYLKKITIQEVSLVKNPANPMATILDLKNINRPTFRIELSDSWDGTMAEKKWRDYSNSTETPSMTYKNGFLYFDAQSQDKYGAYHLQIVDVIDGEPVINQKAVIGVYQAIQGARNGLKVVPESEMPRLQATITALYKKINILRTQEEIELLPTPSFTTKSEFDIAFEQIKNSDGSLSDKGLSKYFNKIRKGEINLTQSQIKRLVKTCVNIQQQKNIEKILDIEKCDIIDNSVPPVVEAQVQTDNEVVVKSNDVEDFVRGLAISLKKSK